MNREIQVTGDGSHTVFLREADITYHSKFGAIQESEQVYIGAGFQPFIKKIDPIRVFEMGFGTGLNAFLTLLEARQERVKVEYETVETAPLRRDEYRMLNYAKWMRKPELGETFMNIHQAPWGRVVKMGSLFTITKHQVRLEDFTTDRLYHVIYFDAFAPAFQPELWTLEVFNKMYDMLYDGGVLTTYCAKGEVRRNLEAAGFVVEKLPGPWGKREILRASKTELG